MGYTQETDWHIKVPVANLETLFADQLEVHTNPVKIEDILSDAVRELTQEFGEHSDIDYKQDDDTFYLTGWTAGKVGDDSQSVERLADAKASGTIDGQGEEGSKWRLRFHGDGRMTEHRGVVVYEGDDVVQVG